MNIGITPSFLQCKSTPSFGMARLNDYGKEVAAELGSDVHTFLEPKMFDKPKLIGKPAIADELVDRKRKFSDVCKKYGCSDNPEANADFIRNQIFSSKSQKFLSKAVDSEEYMVGLTALYDANYDNPVLSKKETFRLLDELKESMKTAKYLEQSGFLEQGTY